MNRSLSIVGIPRVYVRHKKSQKKGRKRFLYYLQFVHPETGKWKSQALGPGREYAQHMKRQFETAIQEYFVTGRLNLPEKGKAPTLERLTFEELWEHFETHKKSRVRKSTLDAYRMYIRKFQEVMPEIKFPDDADERTAEVYINRRIEDGIKPVTVNSDIRNLKIIFGFGAKRKLIRRNPFEDVESLKEGVKEKRILTYAEVDTLINIAMDSEHVSLRDHQRMAGAIVLGSAGLRRGEVIAARWSDIDLATGRIDIRCSNDFQTKNGRNRVSFITDPEKLDFLKRLKLAGLGLRNGKPFLWNNPRNLSREFKKVARSTGIDCTFKDLRRTFVTWLTEAGENAMTIMKLVGHGSVEVTRDNYLSLGEKAMREAVERAQRFAKGRTSA